MGVKEISVGFTYTKNLGNYESIKIDAGFVIAIGEGDDPEAAFNKAWTAAKAQVIKGVAKFQEGGRP
ncbi:hypothetical protein [Paenibacillus sp. GYB004]|uniref:hypothetical protein n=1 Tax=unclassified Paenibacillus TaxID=185978 RepID=UPI002F96AC92